MNTYECRKIEIEQIIAQKGTACSECDEDSTDLTPYSGTYNMSRLIRSIGSAEYQRRKHDIKLYCPACCYKLNLGASKNKTRKLTPEMVGSLRIEYAKTPFLLEHRAAILDISYISLYKALSGAQYKELNNKYPPIYSFKRARRSVDTETNTSEIIISDTTSSNTVLKFLPEMEPTPFLAFYLAMKFDIAKAAKWLNTSFDYVIRAYNAYKICNYRKDKESFKIENPYAAALLFK